MSEHTPGPWQTRDRNWRNEPAGNRIYITGDHYIDDGMDEDDAEPIETPMCTGVAVVEGNNTSREVTAANARLIAAAPELLGALEAPTWLVWSNYHRMWWAPNRCNYSNTIEHAGRYTLEEAMVICTQRSRDEGGPPPEIAVPSPEWIKSRATAIGVAKGGVS